MEDRLLPTGVRRLRYRTYPAYRTGITGFPFGTSAEEVKEAVAAFGRITVLS